MPAAKSADLCWGQHHHLLRYQQVPAASRYEAHITTSFPLPPGCTTAHVRAALTHLVRRHEVLRTTYDLAAWPAPRQRVGPPAPLPVAEVATEGTPKPADVVKGLVETPFDLGRDWPMRACVVTTGGELKRLHLVFNHLAFDDVSLDVLAADLEALLAGRAEGRPVALEPVEYQPVDLAKYEESRDPEDDLEHWRVEVTWLPTDVYAKRRKESTGAHSASLTSPSLLKVARELAARRRVWPSAVHLAAYAVTMAAYTGEPLIAHRLYTSQRDASGFGSVLTCLSYPTLVALDLTDDPPFSVVLNRAAARIEASIAHAHVPFDRIAEEVSRESSRRGEEVRVVSEVNFLDNAPRSCAAKRDRLAWHADPVDWAKAGSDLYFRIYEWADGITLALQVLDEVMDRAAVEAFLRGYAQVIQLHEGGEVDLRASEVARLAGFGEGLVSVPGGSNHPERSRVPEAEHALTAAVALANALPSVDPADSYVLAGGRVLRLPRVLEALREAGWDGVSLNQLAGALPLRTLAARLRPATPENGAVR